MGSLEARRTVTEFVKVAVASIIAAGAMLAVLALGDAIFGAGDLRAMVQLVFGTVAGLGAYVFVAGRLGVEDLELLERLLPRRG